jgi:hypothetical protein
MAKAAAKKRTTDAPPKRTAVPARKPSAATDLLEPQGTPPLSKYQGYRQGRVARRDLKNAEYNPRQIDPHARKELLRIIRSKKLVSSLTWNERTGNLVGGHQRLNILDALEKSENYSLDVDIVDVSLEEEKELNLILNNFEIQGQYDPVKLEALFESGVNFQSAGFLPMTIQTLFPESPRLESMFSVASAPPAVQRDMADLQELSEQERPAAKKKRQADETPEERITRMKAEKKRHREDMSKRDDTEFYAPVICQNREEREHLMERLGLHPNERYIDLRVLLAHLEVARIGKAS